MKGLIYNSLINSCIIYNEFFLVDDVLRNCDYMKEEINNIKAS